jgi:hypothetical protein
MRVAVRIIGKIRAAIFRRLDLGSPSPDAAASAGGARRAGVIYAAPSG